MPTLHEKTICEVLEDEEFARFLSKLPEVTDEEIAEIEKLHGKPKPRKAARSIVVDV